MSLHSTGQHFRMELPEMKSVDHKTGNLKNFPNCTFYQFIDKNDEESVRQAFMKMMEEFSHSSNFKSMVYELSNKINLNIEHLVHTSI